MRRAQGYGVEMRDGRVVHEQDSFTCGHCNSVVFVNAKTDPASLGGVCKLCMTMTCAHCTAKAKCDPFEKKLERMESRDRFLRNVG